MKLTQIAAFFAFVLALSAAISADALKLTRGGGQGSPLKRVRGFDDGEQARKFLATGANVMVQMVNPSTNAIEFVPEAHMDAYLAAGYCPVGRRVAPGSPDAGDVPMGLPLED